MVCRAPVRMPWILERPITARIALSPTAFTVASGACTLKRKSPTWFGFTFHSTEKSTSTMFSSPVSIRLSCGMALIVLPRRRSKPMSILLTRSACGLSAVSIG
jgi:hypothetical protein